MEVVYAVGLIAVYAVVLLKQPLRGPGYRREGKLLHNPPVHNTRDVDLSVH